MKEQVQMEILMTRKRRSRKGGMGGNCEVGRVVEEDVAGEQAADWMGL